MFFRRLKTKTFSQGIAELLELVCGIGSGENGAEHLQQTIDLDMVDQAPDGKRRLAVLHLGELGRMQKQTMIDQQAQDQAAA